MTTFHESFATRLKHRDPSAVETLKKLVGLAQRGHKPALVALAKTARYYNRGMVSAGVVQGDMAMGAFAPVSWVAHMLSKVFGASGTVLGKAGNLASKPFHFVETKLAAVK